MKRDYVAGGNSQTKTFDTGTVKGLKAAERYQTKLENNFHQVIVTTVGFNRVQIFGRDKIDK